MVAPNYVPPRVLIVHDVYDVRQGLRFLLEASEFRVAEAWNGMTAIDQILKEEFDVVLVDLYMPGTMDGIGLIDAIRRSRKPHPAIIAMSGAAPCLPGEPAGSKNNGC